MPTPVDVFKRAGELLADPFRRNGENDLGIAWHLLDSLRRVFSGYALAVLVGVPWASCWDWFHGWAKR
jgi:nitrate/nitrite transport system permease protein